MTRQARRILFYVLLGLFFVIGGGVVLYAEGWRIDLGGHVEKVGGIFVRSFPVSTSITLDKTSIPSRPGILSHGTLITNLFPKTYDLTLTAAGYNAWHEKAPVLPSLVTEYKSAVLVPASGTRAASGTVIGFAIAADEQFLTRANGNVTWRGQILGSGSIVSASPAPKNVLIQSRGGIYELYDLNLGASTNLSIPENVTSIMIDPYDATKIVVDTASKILLYDTAQKSFSKLDHAATHMSLGPAVAIGSSLLAWTHWTAASGTSIAIYDIFSNALVTSTQSIAGKNTGLSWMKTNQIAALQNDGSLYLYDTGSGTLTKIASDVRSFSATNDGSLIAAVEGTSMEIFSFVDAVTYHRFNLPDAGRILEVVWYKDMNHLFVVYPDHVSFLDIDDAALDNFSAVAQGTSPFYSAPQNALYIIDPSHALLRFDFPS